MAKRKGMIFIYYYALSRIYFTLAYNFFPFLIDRSLKKRKGNCKQCGYCCGSCRYLKGNNCTVYNNRPRDCNWDFPITKFERKHLTSKDCGYYWK